MLSKLFATTSRTLVLLTVFLVILGGCGKGNSEGCDTTVGTPQYEPNTNNNYECQPNEILVGYNPNAINGPLLCATLIVSCPKN